MAKAILFLEKSNYTKSKADEVALLCGVSIGSLDIKNYHIRIVSCSVIDNIVPFSNNALMLGVPTGMSMFYIYRHIPSSRSTWCKSTGLGVGYFKKAFDERFEYVESKNKKTVSFFKGLFNISEEEVKQFQDFYFKLAT